MIARRKREEAELVAKLRASARDVWRRAAPIPGTPAELYLRARGIGLVLPPLLRFAILRHTPSGQRLPAMVAAVQEPDGAIAAVHRTYLSADGGKAAVDPVRMMLGEAGGGAVRLAPAGPTLCLAEGIEDALSMQQETGLPCWAALGAGNLDKLTLPEAVRTVIVCADNDPAGEAGARAAARAYLAAGREVRIARPPAPHKDFNDLLRADSRPREAA